MALLPHPSDSEKQDRQMAMSLPFRRNPGSGPHLTTRRAALFGVFDPALLAFSFFLLLIVFWVSRQFQNSGVAQGAVIGAGVGLLTNIVLALPSRLLIPSGIPHHRVERVLDASGYGPYRTADCFAPKRWRGFQFPGQWIRLSQTGLGLELIGPYAALRRIRALL